LLLNRILQGRNRLETVLSIDLQDLRLDERRDIACQLSGLR
jgi:hypothetical protein